MGGQFKPEYTQDEAARRYHAARANFRTNWIVGISWPLIIMISLVLLFLNKSLFKGFRFWITAVIFLGPIALMVGYIALKICKTISCRDTFIETLGTLVPVVVSYIVAISILILSMLSGNATWQLQVGLIFVLPIIIVLFFHSIFLAPMSNRNPGQFLLNILGLLLITTFSGLGSMIPVALPLVNKSLNMSLLMQHSPLSFMTWWAITALGALPCGLLISLFQRWAIKKNLRLWITLTVGEEEISIPKWGKLWGWILISTCILFAGLLIGVLFLKYVM